MKLEYLKQQIDEASKVIGSTWPLYSFVTSNPLSGYEKLPFEEAVASAKKILDAKVYPDASIYRKAYQKGEINSTLLSKVLKEEGFEESPDYYLEQLELETQLETRNPNHDLDRNMVKWLSAFMDEGLAEWQMPHKESGFYSAWRKLAPYDQELGKVSLKDIPRNPENALTEILSDFQKDELRVILTSHLAALPGWTGYIKHREEQLSPWQQAYPISILEYLAARLWTAKHLKAKILPPDRYTSYDETRSKLQHLWLVAWEESWQNKLIGSLQNNTGMTRTNDDSNRIPDAQFVFCIDTRSELIRRHIESKGDYETFGYAGFFGIAMDYEDPKKGITYKACPPIVPSSYKVSEIAQPYKEEAKKALERKNEVSNFWSYFLKRMKNMLPSTFGFVEGSGFLYGLQLFFRTTTPAKLHRIRKRTKKDYETICDPDLLKSTLSLNQDLALSNAEKAAIVKSAFELMGWHHFAPLVLFVGHGSQSANNPFGSSLDCGACAASPGRHNARMLAKLANDPEVRIILKDTFSLNLTDKTIFLGAEHNTTTDEIVVFDSHIPATHHSELNLLKKHLAKAQETATMERLGCTRKSIAKAHTQATNWGETRPEWGLAKNASFVIAPRKTTQNHTLDGRCFLHSYDWKTDSHGKALETIMQGPMVVTQWINNHYYFASVDTDKFGGGTKTTHNITGKFGVVQGNGGDLKMGLPWESLYETKGKPYHLPLRLSVIIQAPLKRVKSILSQNTHLQSLADNNWLYLIVLDPLEKNKTYKYRANQGWGSFNEPKNPAISSPKEQVLEELEVY